MTAGEADKDMCLVLMGYDHKKTSIWTMAVEQKRADEVAVKLIVSSLDFCGYFGVKVALKSDQEETIIALKKEVAIARKTETRIQGKRKSGDIGENDGCTTVNIPAPLGIPDRAESTEGNPSHDTVGELGRQGPGSLRFAGQWAYALPDADGAPLQVASRGVCIEDHIQVYLRQSRRNQ